jgi:hypothetical protein
VRQVAELLGPEPGPAALGPSESSGPGGDCGPGSGHAGPAWAVLAVVLPVAAAGPCPALGPLLAALPPPWEPRRPAEPRLAGAARPARALPAWDMDATSWAGPEEEALWLLAGRAARAAVPALAAAAEAVAAGGPGPGGGVGRLGECEGGRWAEAVAAGRAVLARLEARGSTHVRWRALATGVRAWPLLLSDD